MKRIDGVK